MTFTGKGAKGAADPVKIGLAHMQRCQEQCRGVNPYTTSLNKPLDEAVAALPTDALRQLDAQRGTAAALVSAWMQLGGDGLRTTTIYQRYIHAHSLLRAAINANTLQYIAPLAGREAAEELQLLVMGALEEGATDFAILTGREQLTQLAKMLGDYSVLATAEALGIIASRQAPKSDDMEAEMSKIMCMGNARKILSSLPQARQQQAGNATALQMLDKWESLARSTLDGQ